MKRKILTTEESHLSSNNKGTVKVCLNIFLLLLIYLLLLGHKNVMAIYDHISKHNSFLCNYELVYIFYIATGKYWGCTTIFKYLLIGRHLINYTFFNELTALIGFGWDIHI